MFKFLYQFLNSDYFEQKCIESSRGIAQLNMSTEWLKDYPLPCPSLSEQQAIVRELDGINRLIDLQEEQLREYDRLAQSLYFNMFGDVNRNHYGYDIIPLSEAFSLITDGTHQTPIYTDDNVNGYKFLSAKDVISGVIDWSNIKYIPQELHEVLYKRLAPRRNDILLCKNGTTGVCALVDTDEVFDIYVSLALLRPRDGILPIYLVYAINNPATKEQFDSSLKGVGVPNLHLGEIRKTNIILPPLSLQQTFAAQIEAIEQQKALVRRSLDETRTLLAARMQYYFE
jgi:type I restriction enzyme S subunit